METIPFYYLDKEELIKIANVPETSLPACIDSIRRYEDMTQVTSSKPVEIVEVNEDHYRQFRVERGKRLAGGDLLGKVSFPSAREASTYIGCRSNEVALALGAAKRRGETKAAVRGVMFRYMEDAPE